MPFNGSGVYQRLRSWVADATAGVKVRADYHDSEDDGFADGLTNCITKDGQTVVTQNIPWNSKRITGLEDPVNAQDAATKNYADTKFTTGGTLGGDWTVGGALTVTGLLTANGGEVINGDLTVNGNGHITGGLTVDGELVASASYLRFGAAGGPGYIIWNGGASYALGGAGNIWHTGNFNPANYQPLLGFTPVQQGGGAAQATNKIYIGWDGGGLRAQVDGSDLGRFAFGASLVNNGRLAFAGDIAVVNAPGGMYEPYNGAVMSGFQWTNVGYPIITYIRFRYMQLFTTGWFTCGYA